MIEHSTPKSTLVDAHVHIHDCFDLTSFLNGACGNFRQAALDNDLYWPSPALLMLTESAGSDYFGLLRERATDGSAADSSKMGDWRLKPNAEATSLSATGPDSSRLVVIAGRQIVTAEGLEVLALATTAHLPDGESIRKTLAAVAELDGISVLPWGFGKWTASRGRILTELLSEHGHFEFFLGDNSGRLRAAPEPGVFSYARERGIKVLPGTDPLPFRSQQDRAGSYGFWVSGSVSYETPASDLKRLLYQTDLHAYGRGEGLVRFGINQVAMQVVKRVRRRPAHGRPRETAEGK